MKKITNKYLKHFINLIIFYFIVSIFLFYNMADFNIDFIYYSFFITLVLYFLYLSFWIKKIIKHIWIIYISYILSHFLVKLYNFDFYYFTEINPLLYLFYLVSYFFIIIFIYVFLLLIIDYFKKRKTKKLKQILLLFFFINLIISLYLFYNIDKIKQSEFEREKSYEQCVLEHWKPSWDDFNCFSYILTWN